VKILIERAFGDRPDKKARVFCGRGFAGYGLRASETFGWFRKLFLFFSVVAFFASVWQAESEQTYGNITMRPKMAVLFPLFSSSQILLRRCFV